MICNGNIQAEGLKSIDGSVGTFSQGTCGGNAGSRVLCCWRLRSGCPAETLKVCVDVHGTSCCDGKPFPKETSHPIQQQTENEANG